MEDKKHMNKFILNNNIEKSTIKTKYGYLFQLRILNLTHTN